MQQISIKRIPHTSVGGVQVALATEDDLTQTMLEDAHSARNGQMPHPVTVYSCNGQTLSVNASDPEFSELLAHADIIHADGQFIVWASGLGGRKAVPERTATTDFIHAAGRAAAENGLSFYLLGGEEEINRGAAEKLMALYPGLTIAGRRTGYFSEDEEDQVIADINASGADILWVGLGKPKEQFFSHRNKARLNCAWIVTCGGCFHFLVGDYKRAPDWMQKAGLEWLHRLATGPRYLIVRYLYTNPHAIWQVIRHDLLGRKRKPSGAQPN